MPDLSHFINQIYPNCLNEAAKAGKLFNTFSYKPRLIVARINEYLRYPTSSAPDH